MDKVILITGASSGIGRKIGGVLVRAGYHVYGTSRRPAADELDGMTMIPLDVASDESVAAAVANVISRAGRLDVLINNAGVEMISAAEETSIDEAKALFETNLFGVMRMVKAALPHMRSQRSGTIINIGSIGGFLGSPYQSIYCASKHALEGYSESLAYEVAPFGVHVALVEPAFFKSDIANRKFTAANPMSIYDSERQTTMKSFERLVTTAPDPAPVAERILSIVSGHNRSLRNRVGWESLVTRFKYSSPEWFIRNYVLWTFGLRKQGR